MAGFKIIELTKENKKKYLDKVADLEEVVLDSMEKQGKTGQLFITGKEDISNYIHSNENSVLIAEDDNNNVISATYITQGQQPFTYNDITKYFKTGDTYKEYIKSKYSKNNYRQKMLEIYSDKLDAYEYAKNKILKQNPKYNSISELVKHEENSQNEFDEKSILRENLNTYMSEYMANINKSELYEEFYWMDSNDISEEFQKKVEINKSQNSNIKEYEDILQKEKLIIHEKSIENQEKYFESNTNNSLEIDTYITDPHSRHCGIARILVYEGLKKRINEHFEDKNQDKIYICSTLHRKNLSSKYVSDFFGLTDSIFVKRRHDRDREVHITQIKKEDKDTYLNEMQDKLIVLYNYNPENKQLSNERKQEILQEQLDYENNQYRNFNKVRNNTRNYTGNITDILSKLNKMGRLKKQIKELNNKPKDINNGDER